MFNILLRFSLSLVAGIGIYFYLHYSETGTFSSSEQLPKVFAVLVITSGVAGHLLTLSSRTLTRLIGWKKHTVTRFVTGLVVNSALMYLVILVAYQGLKTMDELWLEVFGVFQSEEISLKLLILLFVIIFVHSIFDLTIFSYRQFATGQIESVKLARRQYQLQFEALKSQLSPHYLFNCLNTISSLIYTSPESAETFIRKLVQTYQYILNTKDERLVTLNRELEFVRAYNYLLKIRYPEGLSIDLDIPETVMDTLLPPLTLQMLIENAVKHNDLSEQQPLEIRIGLDDKQLLSVTNTKNEKKMKAHSFNIGIENIKNRYRFFTEKSVQIINDDLFKVGLPLLNLNSKHIEEGIYS